MNTIDYIYICYFTGVILWQFPAICDVYNMCRNRIIIKRNLRQYTDKSMFKTYGLLGRHIQMVISGASMEKHFTSPEVFFIVSLVASIGTAAIISMVQTLPMALVCGACAGMTPYLLIVIRLHDKRVSRSAEGDILIQELLSNYKIYDFNMKEAVEKTAFSIEGADNAKVLMIKLAKSLNTTATAQEVEKHLSQFRYAINTSWCNALASDIFFGHVHGIRVDVAMEDLQQSMLKGRRVREHGKRENNEAAVMIRYISPLCMLLSVAGACKFFGFTVKKYMSYQFGTALGLKWFLIMVILYICGFAICRLFSGEKMDI